MALACASRPLSHACEHRCHQLIISVIAASQRLNASAMHLDRSLRQSATRTCDRNEASSLSPGRTAAACSLRDVTLRCLPLKTQRTPAKQTKGKEEQSNEQDKDDGLRWKHLRQNIGSRTLPGRRTEVPTRRAPQPLLSNLFPNMVRHLVQGLGDWTRKLEGPRVVQIWSVRKCASISCARSRKYRACPIDNTRAPYSKSTLAIATKP